MCRVSLLLRVSCCRQSSETKSGLQSATAPDAAVVASTRDASIAPKVSCRLARVKAIHATIETLCPQRATAMSSVVNLAPEEVWC